MSNYSELKIWFSPTPLGAKSWKLLMGSGILYLALGVIMLVWPKKSAAVLLTLLGAAVLIFGLEIFISAIRSKAGKLALIRGLFWLIVGALILASPWQTAILLSVMVGVWMIFSAVDQLFTAAMAPAGSFGKIAVLVSGIFSLIFGGMVIVFPLLGITVIELLLALYLIIFGVFAISGASAMRQLR